MLWLRLWFVSALICVIVGVLPTLMRTSSIILLLVQSTYGLRLGVTGAHGFLGTEIVCQAVSQGHTVRAIGKPSPFLPSACEVLDLGDLTDMASARTAADGLDAIIHTASVFRRCDDMEAQLVTPNIALAEAMVCACAAAGARLVLTSSMAAVRGNGQTPLNGLTFTSADWNTVSRRDGPSFEPYQFSKAASEQRAWELAKEVGLELTTICPPMIFGPPRDPTCSSFSVQMVTDRTLAPHPHPHTHTLTVTIAPPSPIILTLTRFEKEAVREVTLTDFMRYVRQPRDAVWYCVLGRGIGGNYT